MSTSYKLTSPGSEDVVVDERRWMGGRKALTACGATQLILGVGALAVGSSSFGIKPANYQVAAGIWGGALVSRPKDMIITIIINFICYTS